MVRFGGGVPKHKHPEAFVRMQFSCAEKCCSEIIWNSRDGIAPTMVLNRRTQHQMTWQQGRGDLYAPSYQAKPGERVFVNATPDMVRSTAERWVEAKWDLPSVRGQFKEKKDLLDYVIKDWRSNGNPWLVTIEPEKKLLVMKAGDTFPFICPVCQQHYPYNQPYADGRQFMVHCTCGFSGTSREFSEITFEIQVWVN